MRTRHVPTVVLGAGVMGSATAYHLASRGRPVVLVERFGLGHDRGSSHGPARIIRHSYADPDCARLMPDAFRAWRELEADAARPLFGRAGGVSICPASVDYVARVVANLEVLEVPHRRMSGLDWNRAMPAFGVDGSADVVFEPDAGILSAALALSAMIELARSRSAEVMDHAEVRRIDLGGARPALVFDDQVLVAERLVVAAGPWTGRLLPSLAETLRPTRQRVLYLRPSDPEPFSIGRLPAFISIGEGEDDAYYGMPGWLGSGLKVARHGGPAVDPDAVDGRVEDDYRDEVRAFLARTVPGLATAPIDRAEVCLYTMAEGDRFRVGPLPGRPDVIVASPCGGHGFKFAALIGRVIADLATDGSTSIPIGPWRVD